MIADWVPNERGFDYMNSARLPIVVILVLGHAGLSVAGQLDANRQVPAMATQSLCELLRRPESSYGRRIRIKAKLRRLITSESILLSSECEFGDKGVSVAYDEGRFDELFDKVTTAMNRWQVDEVEVTVVGILHGPRSSTTTFNYGHQGRLPYQFEIASFERIGKMKK